MILYINGHCCVVRLNGVIVGYTQQANINNRSEAPMNEKHLDRCRFYISSFLIYWHPTPIAFNNRAIKPVYRNISNLDTISRNRDLLILHVPAILKFQNFAKKKNGLYNNDRTIICSKMSRMIVLQTINASETCQLVVGFRKFQIFRQVVQTANEVSWAKLGSVQRF
jgi:hypothetical protein